ncbi:hypothetical protein MtrunA17_Chr6g0485581 [Medicago truncatula]|uniref:Transmembrane protein, putative n=1 Tax=Medicago truncatula TaxID=3880 RepID=A0A072UDE8_MEDTR|nr:transmembrane protein, putative [Medicago truncatula]RHN52902.1 hypothetical protein MtrunA17_Chr6g0485581 [Medicago truncatula]
MSTIIIVGHSSLYLGLLCPTSCAYLPLCHPKLLSLFKPLAHALLAYGYLPLHLTHAMLYSQQRCTQQQQQNYKIMAYV